MKRLIFCFDGTWNRLDAKNVTNVVHTARNISLTDNNGTAQIVHYDQGVGTKPHERIRGGLFGIGLMDNLEEAYRFLVFNYELGDEIYLFGFSRGAYSARSFAGLIFNCGIVNDVKKIPNALRLYASRFHDDQHMDDRFKYFRQGCSPKLCVDQKEFDWRLSTGLCEFVPLETNSSSKNVLNFKVPDLHILNIKYIGVWDTVGALGVPKSLSIASLVNRRHQFHDCNLSQFVASARHAVAIDETRRSFEPTLWTNVDEMNKAVGYHPASDQAPYQQQWFPGVHGAVGGGGDYTGLSDEALEWVWGGAKRLGLAFSTSRSETIYEIKPDHKDYLNNVDPPKWYHFKRKLMGLLPKQSRSHVKDKKNQLPNRDIRPKSLHQVSMSTRLRWKENGHELRPNGDYRPRLTLDLVADDLDVWNIEDIIGVNDELSVLDKAALAETKSAALTHTVVRGDTLGAIAKTYLGEAKMYKQIFAANRHMLTHPDRIYPGQILVIPQSEKPS